jgi:hypothetical protein
MPLEIEYFLVQANDALHFPLSDSFVMNYGPISLPPSGPVN